MRAKVFLAVAVIFLTAAFRVSSQNRDITVKGTVYDQNSASIPLVSVLIKGTTKGVSADLDGNYTITVPSTETILEFSSIGYNTVDVKVGNRNKIDVILETDQESLDEVMVVAYGTAKRGTFTGSAAVVSHENFESRPTTSMTQALTGTTAGLQVGTSNGQPGSSPTLRVRGMGSFNASSSPLIVLDGLPYGDAMSSINAEDIESVTVLKDASSAALYGARAANGVILITTKKGKKGQQKVEARYNIGFVSRQTKDYERVGTTDFMELYWESARNEIWHSGAMLEAANAQAAQTVMASMTYNAFGMDPDQLYGTDGKLNPNAKLLWADDVDWRRTIEHVGIRHDAGVSLSGANDKTDYYASVGYLNDTGYVKGSNLTRYTLKANVNSQITKWLKTGVNSSFTMSDSEGNQNESSGNNTNLFRFVRFIGNIYPIHLHNPETGEYLLDENGNKLYDFGTGYSINGLDIPKRDAIAGNNPAAENPVRYDGYRRVTLNEKAYAEVTFLQDFKATINVGLGENLYDSHFADIVFAEKGNAGYSTKNHSTTTTWNINQMLSYNKDFGKHHFDALVGHESYKYDYTYLSTSMQSQIFNTQNYEYGNYTELRANPNSYVNTYRVEGYLSRANYDYDEKYFASASFRRDGSSRFAAHARWGNFWSVGGGWRIDKENFMANVDAVDMLKLRASYGEVGNDDLDAYYPWRATYTTMKNGTQAGYVQGSLGNKDLSWEVSHNLDAAVEFDLFKSRLGGTIEFFDRQSSNLLFSVPQPLSAGADNLDVNAGTMRNLGLEVSLDYAVIQNRDLTWRVSGNATYIDNELVDLPIADYTSSPYKIAQGHPRYEFWLKQWEGVNPETGYNLYEADLENEAYEFVDGELIEYKGKTCTEDINHAKYDWSGIATPKVTGGFGTQLTWKNLSFSMNFYYQLGGLYYDSTYKALMTTTTSTSSAPGHHALHVDILDRWQKAGDITNVPRLSGGTDATNIDAASSTRWLVSSNSLELTNVNLTYSLPKKFVRKANIKDAKIYFSADNPLLITARRGMYPRRNFNSGYDGNANLYLPSRAFSFGTKLSF